MRFVTEADQNFQKLFSCLLCLSVFVLLEYSWLYVKTLLGDFWKLLVTNFLPNQTQMHGHIVYFYVTLMFLLIILVENWDTFYSNLSSH